MLIANVNIKSSYRRLSLRMKHISGTHGLLLSNLKPTLKSLYSDSKVQIPRPTTVRETCYSKWNIQHVFLILRARFIYDSLIQSEKVLKKCLELKFEVTPSQLICTAQSQFLQRRCSRIMHTSKRSLEMNYYDKQMKI